MLEEYCHQRVGFTATLAGSRASSPKGYALLFQNVRIKGQERQMSDQIWANLSEPIPVSLVAKSEMIHFHDEVEFTAIVEHHRKDPVKLCLREVEALDLVKASRYHFDYTIGKELYQPAAEVEYTSKKEPMKQETPYAEFLYRIGEEHAESICFRYAGCEKDRLIFEVLVDGKMLEKPGYYRPYVDKEHLFIGQSFALPITVQKEYFNLQNTFVLAKYINVAKEDGQR